MPEYAAPPTGEVTLAARLRVDETDPDHRPPFTADGHRQLYVTDARTLAAATGLAITPGYLALTAGQPGVLDAAPGRARRSGERGAVHELLLRAAVVDVRRHRRVRPRLLRAPGDAAAPFTPNAPPRRNARRTALRRELSGEDDDDW